VQLQDEPHDSTGAVAPAPQDAVQELPPQATPADPEHEPLPLQLRVQGPNGEQVTLRFLHTSVPVPQLTTHAWSPVGQTMVAPLHPLLPAHSTRHRRLAGQVTVAPWHPPFVQSMTQ
jgi:hypothetical protein